MQRDTHQIITNGGATIAIIIVNIGALSLFGALIKRSNSLRAAGGHEYVRATRERRSPVALIAALPLLGGLSLRSLATLPAPALVWSVWATALVIGAILGARLQSRWLIQREGAYVTLKGEWLTLVVLVAIFGSNFVFGALRAVAPCR